MTKLFTLGAVFAMAAVLAACGGSGSSGDSATTESSGGSTVSVANIGGAGAVLVDSSVAALYASDQETAAGMVLCSDACNSFWQPLTVNGAPKGGPVATHLAVANRPDGSRQVTYDGKFLYTFTQEGPGEVTGDGFMDAFNGQQFTWHVVSAGNTGSSAGRSSETSPGAVGY